MKTFGLNRSVYYRMLVYAVILVVVLVIFILMLDSNSVMKAVFSPVYGVHGKVSTEMFSNHGSEFVPAFDGSKSYEERGKGPASPDNFEEPEPMSAYDGLHLDADKDAAAKVMENQTDAKHRVVPISKKPMMVLLGSGAPPAHEMRPAQPDPYQTLPVDGEPGSPKSMFMFANNAMSPACCPSQYTSDLGCVCLTPEQKKWMSKRGENRSAPSEY
jgi:hypothetical protein